MSEASVELVTDVPLNEPETTTSLNKAQAVPGNSLTNAKGETMETPDESPHDEDDRKYSSEKSFWSSEEEASDGSNHGLGVVRKQLPPLLRRPSLSGSDESVDAPLTLSIGTKRSYQSQTFLDRTTFPRTNAPLEGSFTSSFHDEEESQENAFVHCLRSPDGIEGVVEAGNGLSIEDIQICQRLELEYERALEEREIGYNARYKSVRQSTCFSMTFMLFYLFIGVLFYNQYIGWSIAEAMFFLVYTITTVGYGSVNFPRDQNFQLFTIVIIFTGVATLTIMVAQVYQCIALEATRAQHARDKAELAKRGKSLLTGTKSFDGMTSMRMGKAKSSLDLMTEFDESQRPVNIWECFLDWFNMVMEKCKWFARDSEIGRAVSIIFPLAGLIALGACVIGPIEGWTVVESLYFACISLTTVGYGEYLPKHAASLWFCICWLPFSVGFMSIYLGNIAAFYIRLSNKNINRLERNMRRRIHRAKAVAAKERLANLQNSKHDQSSDRGSDDANTGSQSQGRSTRQGFVSIQTTEEPHPLFGSAEADSAAFETDRRRRRILEQSNYRPDDGQPRPQGQTMQTMGDIVRAIKVSIPGNKETGTDSLHSQENLILNFRSTESMRRSSLRNKGNLKRKPSFALRVLVQERFAEIIATDIAGFQSHIEIKENTLSVTIDTLKDTADKWLVPRRARKAFRAVTFEALYFVGEHGLITRGAEALFELSPFEFHGLFSPLVAAMGDADTMEGWLNSTDVLADVDLRRDGSKPDMAFNTEQLEEQQKAAFQIGVTSIGITNPDSFTLT